MSIHIMTQVWKHSKQRGAGLLTLLALADWADDDGYAYPSVEKLARKARVSTRTVQRMTDELVEAEELEVRENAGPGGTHKYRITPPVGDDRMSPHTATAKKRSRKPKDAAPMSPPTSTTKEGDIYEYKSMLKSAQMSPNTSSLKDMEDTLKDTSVPLKQNEVRKRLELHFRARTSLQPPKRKSEAGELWWSPLREIAELASWDAAKATGVIDECLSRARNTFQVSSPKSILKTARAVVAERAAGNGAGYSAAADVAAFKKERGLR